MIVTTPSYEMVYLYLWFMTPRLTILPLFLSHTLFLFVFIITKFSQVNPPCCFLRDYILSLNPARRVSGQKLKTEAISPAIQKPQSRHSSVP